VLDVVLEDSGGLWVVSIETVQDCVDMLWPFWRVIEWDAHDGGYMGCGEVELWRGNFGRDVVVVAEIEIFDN
jgi:hypothetical protein